MRTWPDSNASAIERFLRQRRIHHPQTPKTYRRVLCGFQDVVRRCERSSSRVSLHDSGGLAAASAVRSGRRSTLLHRACIIDRFLDFLVREGSIASNPVAELRTKYLIKGSATILRALLAPEPDRALEALRQLPQFGSVLGDLMRNHVALMRTRGFRYDTNTRMFLRFDRFLQRHPELANEPLPVMLQHWAAARSTAFHAADCELLGRALAKARHHLDPSVPVARPDLIADGAARERIRRSLRRGLASGAPYIYQPGRGPRSAGHRSYVSVAARAAPPAHTVYDAGGRLLRRIARK